MKTQMVKVSARISEDLDKRLESAASQARQNKEVWIEAAIAGHLKATGVDPGDVGPLARLSTEDRKRAERFIRFLRRAPEPFKRAVMAGMSELERALKTQKQ